MGSGSPHADSNATPAHAFRRVLVASFLDQSGMRAVLRAARLPLARGARLVLLHVTPPWSVRAGRPAADAWRSLERAAARAVGAASAAANVDVEVVPVVAHGWPAKEIVRVAWQHRCEVIVVGPPAIRVDGSVRGTIARVMRVADLPLLIARGPPGREYQSILCAVGRSVTAVETIALAARLASPEARLALFHAYQIPFEHWLGQAAPDLEDDALAYVRALARDVADEVAFTRTKVRAGEPALAILRAAADERADLVVLGTRGRSGISRALLGSATEWVVANTPFDVAVARSHHEALERH